jgi:hypothetical protein
MKRPGQRALTCFSESVDRCRLIGVAADSAFVRTPVFPRQTLIGALPAQNRLNMRSGFSRQNPLNFQSAESHEGALAAATSPDPSWCPSSKGLGRARDTFRLLQAPTIQPNPRPSEPPPARSARAGRPAPRKRAAGPDPIVFLLGPRSPMPPPWSAEPSGRRSVGDRSLRQGRQGDTMEAIAPDAAAPDRGMSQDRLTAVRLGRYSGILLPQ